jgi:hypothetical protein
LMARRNAIQVVTPLIMPDPTPHRPPAYWSKRWTCPPGRVRVSCPGGNGRSGSRSPVSLQVLVYRCGSR